jgi:predicted DNA repair protein MutK
MAAASNFSGLVNKIISYADSIVLLIVALALVVFLYGLFTYLVNSDDEGKRKDSISYIIAGLIGLFVMTAVWGLLSLLTGTFGVGLEIPRIKG